MVPARSARAKNRRPAARSCRTAVDAYNDRCLPFYLDHDADELLTKIKPSKN
jgi:hypothetical protein